MTTYARIRRGARAAGEAHATLAFCKIKRAAIHGRSVTLTAAEARCIHLGDPLTGEVPDNWANPDGV